MISTLERRCPLSERKYNFGYISIIAVVAVVLLRLTVGWHFFYEGVWKTNPDNEFSAIPFLGLAKGPAAPLFYGMLPDIDGSTRLLIEEKKDVPRLDNPARKVTVECFPTFEEEWRKYYEKFNKKYGLKEDQQKAAEKLLDRYCWSSYDYAAEISSEVKGYKDSYYRYRQSVAAGANKASHQKQRDWDGLQSFRREVNTWSGELSGYGDDFQMQLWHLLDDKQQDKGTMPPIAYGNNKIFVSAPFLGINSWVDFLNFGVTWALTAIGLCLMLGFCSRFAALGGAAFLVAVLLTQPPWPSIYPHVHPEVGHAMIIDKNFVEMIACLVIAALPAGRWAGLDYYLWEKLGGKKLWGKYLSKYLGWIFDTDAPEKPACCDQPKA